MKLKLAIAVSCTEAGCQVRFIDSLEEALAIYSDVMKQYDISAQMGDLLAIDTGFPNLRIVYLWSLVEVIQVGGDHAHYLDIYGVEQILPIAKNYRDYISLKTSIFTDGQVIADFAAEGLPQNPVHIAHNFFSMIEEMYQPLDSPYLRLIDRYTQGPRDDVTPLFADYRAFAMLVNDIASQFDDVTIEYVVGIDALGFILGTALAWHFKIGFLPIRKAGKLPTATYRKEFMDYSKQSKTLEMRTDALKLGAKVLIADDWIETGAQVKAAIELIEQQGGVVVGIAAINIDDNPTTQGLKLQYNAHTPTG
ncbi:MAG: hypothetical protein KC422_25405 [Trueperaceae bacterium]|nr:hypothetical protein [Trueperaceae bacterium]